MILQLAPMEGVIDPVIRELYTRIGGYDMCVTEFIRVTEQLLPPKVYYRYCPELYKGGKTKSGVPVFVQLLGSKAEALLENAQQAVSLGALGLALNFGCPAKTVNKSDGGASLLKDPSRIYKIISHLRENISEDIPITAKVRLGFDDKSKYREIALAVSDGGASYMGVHARTKKEAYKPPAHWEYISAMRELVKIPVLANGDIWTVEDWKKCKEVTGCQDFILGRGAFAHPQLANEIQIANKSNTEVSPVELMLPKLKQKHELKAGLNSWAKTYSLFLEFMDMCIEYKDESYCVQRSKQWMKFLGKTYPEALEQFELIKRMESTEEMHAHHSKFTHNLTQNN